MRLSLLKTATDPDHLQDQGHHQFTYSLYPHAGDVYNAAVEREAFLLNNPLYALEGYRQTGSMIAFNSPYVALDALKRAEDGGAVVLRFHEFTGSHRTVTVTPGFAYSAWAESDLMEHPTGEFADGKITLDVGPFEVKTILIRL